MEIIKQNNLILEENSSSEILEVTKEMYLRQISSWQTSMNDDIKQKYFWN